MIVPSSRIFSGHGPIVLIATLFLVVGCATDQEELQEKRQKRLEDKEKRSAKRPAPLKH